MDSPSCRASHCNASNCIGYAQRRRNVMPGTSTTRRDVLATSAAAGAFSLIAEQMPQAAEGNIAIRPFHNINVPETALADLRQRIAATQWPERETVADQSQGVQLAMIQQLA